MARIEQSGKRLRIGLRLGLTLCFGGLVFIAVAVVLALGIGSAQKNTTDLQSTQARISMSLLTDGIKSHLEPVEKQVRRVALHAATLPKLSHLRETGRLSSIMAGALAGNVTTFGLVMFHENGDYLSVERAEDKPLGLDVFRGNFPNGARPEDMARLKKGVGFWGPVIRHPFHGVPIINFRYPVLADGVFIGAAVGIVRIDELSVTLSKIAQEINGEAFILHGNDHVLAHPTMAGRKFPDRELPLVKAARVGDSLLQVIARGGGTPLQKPIDGIDARIVDDIGDSGYLTLAQTINQFGETPWKLVLSYPLSDVSAEFQRMIAAATAGVIVLIISIIVAVVAARRIARPLTRVADFAEDISNLNLHDLQPLPHSRIREIDEAAMSMNAMRNGLTWFEAYVPKRLVTRLMATEGSAVLGGEQRQLSIMFTDIVGFTSMAEHMTAGETAEFLNDHFRLLADAIEEAGGTIDKFIGDAVMAFWGAPEDQDNHADLAVQAALAIRDALTRDNHARVSQGLAPVGLRVGVHTGPVVVGNIGAPRRMNYTIVGDTVNTANRLEQAARELPEESAVTILVSDDTIRTIGKPETAREAGNISLRGREHGIDAWLL